MKSILKIILGFFTIIFLFILVCIGFFAINKDGNLLGFTIFTASGNSMTPAIQPGDILLVMKDKGYKENDIIVYKNDEDLTVCHRIIKISDVSYITKGDSNNYIDGYNPIIEDVYGKVVFNVINVQTINKYQYLIIGVLIIVPILLSLISRGLNVRSDNN